VISTLLNLVKLHQILNSDLAKRAIAWVKGLDREEQVALGLLALIIAGAVILL